MTDLSVAPRVLGGRYSLIERLGEGGFGAVYSAEDAELQRIVAIKVLDPAKATRTRVQAEQLGERFRREAVATAAIQHRNVVTVFDIGVDGREIYIVMELLSGRPLSEELERWPTGMPNTRVLPLFVDALRGLAEGHAANIVHKDLKPDNLFLADADRPSERICIIDFGVARVLHEQKLTATGKLVGTPRYLAPEYIEDLQVGASLDVYQMGLILVELLCGMPCIPRRLDLVTCCQRHVDGQLKIPAGLREGAIGEVISRATHVDPEARYPTAHEFATALAAVDPESVHVEAPGANRATPRLGVVPLRPSPTQPLHGGVAATSAAGTARDVASAEAPSTRRHSRTGPTKRLGAAKNIAQELERIESEPVEPPPAVQPMQTRPSTAGDLTVIADADPLRAKRWAVYALVVTAFVAATGTAAFLTVGQRKSAADPASPLVSAPSAELLPGLEPPPKPTVEAVPTADAGRDNVADVSPSTEQEAVKLAPVPAKQTRPSKAKPPTETEEMWILD